MSNQAMNTWYSQLDSLMAEHQIDALLITSRDGHLSEYTALENNPRYQLSQFDGSVGDAIFISQPLAKRLKMQAQCLLFVDGRYHLQADRQTDPQFVSVQKLAYGEVMWGSMMAWLEKHSNDINTIGFDGFRFSSADATRLTEFANLNTIKVHSFSHYEIDSAIELAGFITEKPIYQLKDELLGRDIKTNIDALTASYPEGFETESTCYVTAACDDVAYLLNSRGYHGPHMSSHFGYMFVIGKELVLYLPRDCAEAPVNIDNLGPLNLTVIRDSWNALQNVLKGFEVDGVVYQQKGINYVLEQQVKKTWPDAHHYERFEGVTPIRVVKSPQELDAMRSAFIKSSKAIAQTIRWAKYGDEEDHIYTESSLSHKIWDEYQEQGALDLSFNTIAGCGENGALIHYNDNDSDKPLKDGELVLLDSGAYYEEGLATDITRGCFCNHSRKEKPQQWQIDIYTATLKASIAGLSAQIHQSTTGAELDEIIRKVIQDKGYDYAHGTGHGVGIDVHEGGIGISPRIGKPMTENAVVTIEPGIYLADQGGVRVENVVIVKRHSSKDDHFVFENLSFVGYDWELIDLDQLTLDEKEYLKLYEDRCQNLGTEITRCPLF